MHKCRLYPTQSCFRCFSFTISDSGCKQTDGGVRGQGSRLCCTFTSQSFQSERRHAAAAAACVSVCRRLATRRPPVCICLPASGEGGGGGGGPGPSSAPSTRELSPAGGPHRCRTYRQKDVRLRRLVGMIPQLT